MNQNLRRGIAAAAVVLAAPVLSACLPGNFDAATDQVYNPATGVNDRSGSVDVLNAMIVSGSDGAGTLVAALVNNDTEDPDRLTSVSGAGEDASVTVEGGTADIPADGFVQLLDEGPVSVTGGRIQPGRFISLTFAFEQGGSVTLDAPVVARQGAYAQVPVPDAQ